jgi:hypothetical protein
MPGRDNCLPVGSRVVDFCIVTGDWQGPIVAGSGKGRTAMEITVPDYLNRALHISGKILEFPGLRLYVGVWACMGSLFSHGVLTMG